MQPLTLRRIAVYFDTDSASQLLYAVLLPYVPQALTLRRIAVYFDTDSEFWAPGAAWRDLAPHDWDDWFLPGVRCGGWSLL